jgi:hypothetical protein
MKKITFLCLFLLFGSAEAQVRFGVRAGMNLANQRIKIPPSENFTVPEFSLDTRNQMSFHAGGSVNWYVTDFLIVQPNLLFSMRGMRYTNAGNGYTDEGKLTLYYAELPVYAMFKQDVGLAELFIGTGGYVGYGLSGGDKYTTSANTGSIAADQKIAFGRDFKKLDYGIGFQGGINFSFNLQLNIFYQIGLQDIEKAYFGYQTYNRNFGVSLAYLIGGGW